MKLSLSLLLAFIFVGFLACGADPEPTQATAPPVAPNVQAAPQSGTSTAALNPAHGQPGHRCDIAVGAPLDGSAAAQSPPQIDMSKMGNGATTTPVSTGAATTTTTAGLNPAHGEPGHRCDIAVGAPLDGSAAAQSPPQIDMSKMGNGTTAPATTGTGETVALNPAHGEPGHRCDIAVGAPLN